MLMDMCILKFDIYQGKVAPNCLKNDAFDILIFFKKKFCLMSDLKFTLSDVILLLPDNLSGLLKNYIQAYITDQYARTAVHMK